MLRFFVLIHQHAEHRHRDQTQHRRFNHDKEREIILAHTRTDSNTGRVVLSICLMQLRLGDSVIG